MLDVPSQLVGDTPGLVDEMLSAPRDVATPTHAAELFDGYFTARFAAAVDPALRQVVLLSGGIDSIVTLTALVRHLGRDHVEALTVSGEAGGSDTAVASALAAHLGVRHTVATLSIADAATLARRCIALLGVDEMWEVSAALVLRTAFDAVFSRGPAQVWSGDGGDELLAGGVRPNERPADGVLDGRGITTSDPTEWFASLQRKVWITELTENRLVPNFFELVTPDAPLWRAMNTEEACRVAARLQASAVWATHDKEPLRTLAEHLGVPSSLARIPKAPMQSSSGILSTLLASARTDVARIPLSQTYRDTFEEPLEHNLLRLWLHTLDTRPT